MKKAGCLIVGGGLVAVLLIVAMSPHTNDCKMLSKNVDFQFGFALEIMTCAIILVRFLPISL